MAAAGIRVNNLTKIYKVPEREAGLKAAVVSLFKRKNKDVRAVDGITFEIQPGEIVGFLGPNGAGKTTTLKMLSGLLYPSSGELSVLGFLPEKREKAFLQQITLGDLVKKPVRNLSLGERMKAEMVGALLHQPGVLFLDEPTIGVDVTMQRRIRNFIQEYNHERKATVLLTSHYMADVQALCKRVIVIPHGKILYDGQLSGLVDRFSALKTLVVTTSDMNGQTPDMSKYGTVVKSEANRIALRVSRAEA